MHGEGAALGGLGRGVEARLDADPVARIVVRVVEGRHAMIDERDRPVEPRGARLERVELSKATTGARSAPCVPTLPPRARSASGRRTGRTIRACSCAAHPVRNFDRLQANVVETVIAHAPGGPRERVVERRRARDPGPDALGELGEPLPCRRRDPGRRTPRCARPPPSGRGRSVATTEAVAVRHHTHDSRRAMPPRTRTASQIAHPRGAAPPLQLGEPPARRIEGEHDRRPRRRRRRAAGTRARGRRTAARRRRRRARATRARSPPRGSGRGGARSRRAARGRRSRRAPPTGRAAGPSRRARRAPGRASSRGRGARADTSRSRGTRARRGPVRPRRSRDAGRRRGSSRAARRSPRRAPQPARGTARRRSSRGRSAHGPIAYPAAITATQGISGYATNQRAPGNGSSWPSSCRRSQSQRSRAKRVGVDHVEQVVSDDERDGEGHDGGARQPHERREHDHRRPDRPDHLQHEDVRPDVEDPGRCGRR